MKQYAFFDIETLPDENLMPFAPTKDGKPVEFPPPPCHRIVSASVYVYSMHREDERNVFRYQWHRTSTSLEDEEVPLKLILPALSMADTWVSWNGRGFDLPVLLARGMKYGLNVRTLLQHRFNGRSADLCDRLSLYGGSSRYSLDLAARLLGLPGKMGDGSMLGAMTAPEIAVYNESDVVLTTLIYAAYWNRRDLWNLAYENASVEIRAHLNTEWAGGSFRHSHLTMPSNNFAWSLPNHEGDPE